MAKYLFVCLLICVVLCQAFAYVYFKPDNGNGGKCKDDDGNLRNDGDTWYNRAKCERTICNVNGDQVLQQISGCGKIMNPEGCQEVKEPNADYPGCCPTIKC